MFGTSFTALLTENDVSDLQQRRIKAIKINIWTSILSATPPKFKSDKHKVPRQANTFTRFCYDNQKLVLNVSHTVTLSLEIADFIFR